MRHGGGALVIAMLDRIGTSGLIAAITSHEQAVLLAELAALLLVAKGLGAGARRLGVPSVVGELLAGILLGPSVLAVAWPAGEAWLFPVHDPVQSALLQGIAELALIVLCLVIGFETDVVLLRRLGRPAGTLTAGSLVLPLAAGVAVAMFVPAAFRGTSGSRVGVAVFVGLALAVSSLPVIAKIVEGSGITRRDIGQLLLGVGAANDLTGFVLLAVAAALFGSGHGGAGHLVKVLAGFAVAVLLLAVFGQRLVDAALRRLRRRRSGGSVDHAAGFTAIALVCALIGAAIVQGSDVSGAAGAFAAGIVLARSRFDQASIHVRLETMAGALFTPLYFATAGLSVDVTLLHGRLLALFFVVLGVAASSKLIGGYLGARAGRLSGRDGLVLGLGLNGRGALQVIIATAGLAVGVLSPSLFTVVLLVSMVTSVAAPLAMAGLSGSIEGSPSERRRIDREQELSDNIAVRAGRLLVVVDGEAASLTAAEVLSLSWPGSSPVTVLGLGPGADADELEQLKAVLEPRPVEVVLHPSGDPLGEALDEAALSYAGVAVGAAAVPSAGRLFRPLVDGLLAECPTPLLVVRPPRDGGEIRYERVLLPVADGPASTAASEVGIGLARATGAELVAVHVVASLGRGRSRAQAPGSRRRSTVRLGAGLLQSTADRAVARRVHTTKRLTRGASVAGALLDEIDRSDPSVVVLGARITISEQQPFAGHTVEQVLERFAGAVVVAVLPAALELERG